MFERAEGDRMEIEGIRAAETWLRAGAYYVRIRAMAKQYGTTLRRELDEHDTPDTKWEETDHGMLAPTSGEKENYGFFEQR